jgi:uncharacterized protein (TIGR00369 family)
VPTELIDPFEIFVGPVFERGTRGARRFAFTPDARHGNRSGFLHGGMLATLADMTLGQAVWDVTDNAPSVTVAMQMQYLRAVRLDDIVEVTPLVLRRTRALVFVRGEFAVDGEIAFAANGIWKLVGQI